MLYTSAEAAKLLREKKEEYDALLAKEELVETYVMSLGEKAEDARPEYDYAAVQEKLRLLEGQIRTIKHAISAFNIKQEVPGLGMTIDQLLVYIPQLTAMKRKYDKMRARLPKQRVGNEGYLVSTNVVEYTYANYDIEEAEKDYAFVAGELAKAQTALDLVNSTVKFEIPIEGSR